MHEKLIKYFEVPKEAYSYINMMLSKEEMDLIEKMQDRKYTDEELIKLITQNFDFSAEEFIKSCYKRGVINKEEQNGQMFYKSANVYTRLAYFAQYEGGLWKKIPEKDRDKLDQWYVKMKQSVGVVPYVRTIVL